MTTANTQPRSTAGLKAAILTMSFLQMATNAVGVVLADVAAAFPDVPASTIQYLMTFPNLLVVVMSLVSAWLAGRVPKRVIAATGLALGMVAGVLSCLCYQSLPMLFVGAGLLGAGMGLVSLQATSLVSDYFDGPEKDAMLGRQTAAANVGSMLMTFLGGIIAAQGWNLLYLVYLIAAPGLVCTLAFVPRANVAGGGEDAGGSPAEKGRSAAEVLPYFVIAAVFMLLFYVGPSNLSMVVEERSLGGSALSGTASTVLLLGGTLAGLAFGAIASRMGRLTIPLGFAALTVGYLLMFCAPGPVVLCVGSFIVGTGNTLVLPQCMGSVTSPNKRQSTLLMSAVFATANLGTFFSPALTSASELAMGDATAVSRLLFAAILAAVLAAATAVWVRASRK